MGERTREQRGATLITCEPGFRARLTIGGSSQVCSGGGDSTSHSSVSSMRGDTTVGVPSAADSSTSGGSGPTIEKPGLQRDGDAPQLTRGDLSYCGRAGCAFASVKGGRWHLKPEVSRSAPPNGTGVALRLRGAAWRLRLDRSAPAQNGRRKRDWSTGRRSPMHPWAGAESAQGRASPWAERATATRPASRNICALKTGAQAPEGALDYHVRSYCIYTY